MIQGGCGSNEFVWTFYQPQYFLEAKKEENPMVSVFLGVLEKWRILQEIIGVSFRIQRRFVFPHGFKGTGFMHFPLDFPLKTKGNSTSYINMLL
jgi:hypothetical protein